MNPDALLKLQDGLISRRQAFASGLTLAELRRRLRRRQAVRDLGNGRIYRDVDLPDLGVRIELDGKLFHTSTEDRDRDLERDLDAVEEDGTTIRLGFGQVYDRPCSTAAKVAKVLQRHGWSGKPTQCETCQVAA